jgi:hypothetical protein
LAELDASTEEATVVTAAMVTAAMVTAAVVTAAVVTAAVMTAAMVPAAAVARRSFFPCQNDRGSRLFHHGELCKGNGPRVSRAQAEAKSRDGDRNGRPNEFTDHDQTPFWMRPELAA